MGSLSNYSEAKLLDHALKTASFTPPTNIYVGLSTADPGEAGAGLAEPSGGGYARVQCNTWNAASSRASANTNVITFPQASASWGLIAHFALFDAVSGGNLLAYGSISAGSFTPENGDTPRIPAGALTVTFASGGASTYLANKLLDHLLKTASFTQPTNLYVGLSTANPGDSGSGLAEPSGNSYARVQKNTWAAVSSGATSNTGAVTFAEATGSWGTLTHFGVFDASSSGNLLIYAGLDVSKAITSGQNPEFAEGDLDVTIT